MKAVSIVALREKRGSPHFWLENQSATRSGFMPGEHFNLRPYRLGVLLELADQGERTVSRKTALSKAVTFHFFCQTSLRKMPLLRMNATSE